MNPTDFNILELIPQRPPMTQIDVLVSAGEKSARGRLHILDSNMLCKDGFFQEAGLIEFMAQTAAAYTGFKSKTQDRNVAEGYIGAVKNLEIFELPPVNSVISAEITIENEIVGYTIISAQVTLGERILATCEMRILEQANP
jgi:predicted hotdog family 3-hydroxylacyl-ACP dehydratase